MGIKTEYNPDLALRARTEYLNGNRLEQECLPVSLMPGNVYPFLKEGQRNYWLEGEIPLLETKGNQELSRPLASITIIEATHFMFNGKPYTKGTYWVVDVFDVNDSTSHFNGYVRIK